MANRFTDSEKWKDPWFIDLPSKYKLLWLYLVDTCDHAGIWEVNIKVAQFFVGEPFEVSEIKRMFEGRIQYLDDKYWYISKYICFQQKVKDIIELNPGNKCHNSIIKILGKFNINSGVYGNPLVAPSKGLARGQGNSKVKVKVKVNKCYTPNSQVVEVINYLNKVTGKQYSTTTESHGLYINKILSKGYTLEDFKKVIDIKYEEWNNDEDMSKYIRPETLFSGKFDSYLNQKPVNNNNYSRIRKL